MPKPRCHVVGIFHTVNDPVAQSSCAFTQKTFKLSLMVQPHGWEVVEYGNEGSKSAASEHVTLLTRKEYDAFYPPVAASEFVGNRAQIGQYGWPLFHSRLIEELTRRVQPGDIICHPFGRAHMQLVNIFPKQHHVESGVGYSDAPFGCWRITESEAWRHWHWGKWDTPEYAKDKGMNRIYSWVIPNSWIVDDWPYHGPEKNEGYVVYMGRLDWCKGMTTIAECIRENAKRAAAGNAKLLKWVFAGQGNFDECILKQVARDGFSATTDIEYRGVVLGADRAPLVGKARCMIAPSQFIEPQNGSHLEAALCGTPTVASNFGAFTETIRPGVNGFICRTLGEWLDGIERCGSLDRSAISESARARYSIEACGRLYDAAFTQICELSGPGWYSGRGLQAAHI